MRLTRLGDDYAVARAAPATPIPAGLFDGDGFVTVSRTEDELSIVAPAKRLPMMEKIETGWTVFKLHGPFAFDEVGIVAGLSRALAEREIGIFVISTYDTDYILVKASDAEAATTAWRDQGHDVG
ncbi:MAG: ACT domain-containing protein [Pseudomonadota bacterium]